MKNIILSIVSIIVLASCQKTEVEDLTPSKTHYKVTIQVTETGNIRAIKDVFMEVDGVEYSDSYSDSLSHSFMVPIGEKHTIVTLELLSDIPFQTDIKILVDGKVKVTSTNSCLFTNGGGRFPLILN